jgi:hypothetical protein
MQKVERWKTEMPTEQEMLPKDKYSVFDRKVKRYRKGIHSEFGPVWYWRDVIADWLLQRCRSGRGSARDSTPRVSRCVERRESVWGLVYTTCHVTELHRIWRPSGIKGFFYFNLKC